jgi:hypothetical protein
VSKRSGPGLSVKHYFQIIFGSRPPGLERRATVEEAGNGLLRIAEAHVVRWVQFPAGVLFFTLVSGDPESGALYVLDRKTGVFYWLNFDDRKWGGYSRVQPALGAAPLSFQMLIKVD